MFVYMPYYMYTQKEYEGLEHIPFACGGVLLPSSVSRILSFNSGAQIIIQVAPAKLMRSLRYVRKTQRSNRDSEVAMSSGRTYRGLQHEETGTLKGKMVPSLQALQDERALF